MANDNNNKSALARRHFASLLIIPVLLLVFYALRALADRAVIEQWLPEWDTFVTLGAIMVIERVFTYRYAVSQRHVLARDIASTLVNVYLTYAVTAFIILPGLLLLTEYAFGRPVMVASPEHLGPIWLQVPTVLLIVSFFRYWMHRWQHANEFLWKLHSYHHRVTDLKATNTFVSHPIDYALRNVLVFILLGLVGFYPLALLIALPALAVPGIFSHCGGDVKAGALSRWFVTPEVHRWHHSAVVPEGHRYSCNYSVEFSLWDRLFGTYYVPVKRGQTEQPERIGHPEGLADEPNYIRLVLAPLGLWAPVRWLNRVAGRQRAG